MTDHSNADADLAKKPARPFESYTPADHARIMMAETAWSTLESAFRAVVPEVIPNDHPRPTVLIDAARLVVGYADVLLRAAVVASHEQGLTWTQIGVGLDVSKQSAHERFTEHVTAFRNELAQRLDNVAQGRPSHGEGADRFISGWGKVPDTGWYAQKIDAWRAALGEIPGAMTRAGQPGELLAQLADPATAITRLNGLDARSADANAPRCRFTADAQWHEDSEPGEYLTCTLAEGHPGRHHLAVASSYE